MKLVTARDCGVAVGVVIAFFAVQAVVIDTPAPVVITTDLDRAVLRCLPGTLEETSILSLVEHDSGLQLKCQKQEVIPYGSAPRSAPLHYTMLIGKD